MLKLEEITKDAQITGLLPDEVVKVVNVEEIPAMALTQACSGPSRKTVEC